MYIHMYLHVAYYAHVIYAEYYMYMCPQVVKLQAAIKYAEEDLPNCKVSRSDSTSAIFSSCITVSLMSSSTRPPPPHAPTRARRRSLSSAPAMTLTQSSTWPVCCTRSASSQRRHCILHPSIHAWLTSSKAWLYTRDVTCTYKVEGLEIAKERKIGDQLRLELPSTFCSLGRWHACSVPSHQC